MRASHRAVLALAAAVALAAVLGAAPASAAPAGHLLVVGGDRLVTARWTPVAGASAYTVRLTGPGGTARTRTVPGLVARFAGAVDGRPYAVTVDAATAGGPVRVGAGRVTPVRGVPLAVGPVTAAPGPAPDQVTVRWTGGGRATRVRVVAGSEPSATVRPFASAWAPATTRSVVLTVPARLRPFLGAGSGNPVYVRVVQSNGSPTSTSRSGTWALAGTAAAAGPASPLRVAAWNVQSVTASAGFSERNRWAARAPRVAAAIRKAAPDLLLTAELSTAVLDGCTNHPYRVPAQPYLCADRTQLADLQARLPGLRLADDDAYARLVDRRAAHPEWTGKQTAGAHVLYDPARLTPVRHGFLAPALPVSQSFADVTGLGVTGWDGSEPIGADRWLSWAELRMAGSGRHLLAVAAHFPASTDPAVVAIRAQEVKKALPVIDRLAGGLPVVFGGDFNSDATRDPDAVQPVVVADGWLDAAATAARTGIDVQTCNLTGTGAFDSGYGPRPVVWKLPTSRIDYVMLRNSPHPIRYDNVVRRLPDGSMDPALQGSDHTMQLATVGIGDPVR